MSISKEKNEWERTNLEKESRFKRFAFNTMKKATEGIMMVTISLAVVTGTGITKSNNIYGDEKMAENENVDGGAGYAFKKAPVEQQNVSKMVPQVPQHKSIENLETIKILFQQMGDASVVVLPNKENELLKDFIDENGVIKKDEILKKIKGNEVLKKKIGDVNFKALVTLIEKNLKDVKEDVDFSNVTKESTTLLYSLFFANYDEDVKNKFEKADYHIDRKNLLGKVNDKTVDKIDKYYINAVTGKGEGGYKSNEAPRTNQFEITVRMNPNTTTGKLDSALVNADSNAIYREGSYGNSIIETNEDGTHSFKMGNIGEAGQRLKKHIDEFKEGRGSSIIKQIQKNPGKLDEILTKENINLTDDQKKTFELYAEMIKEFNKRLEKITGGAVFFYEYKGKTDEGIIFTGGITAGGEGGIVGGKGFASEIIKVSASVGGKITNDTTMKAEGEFASSNEGEKQETTITLSSTQKTKAGEITEAFSARYSHEPHGHGWEIRANLGWGWNFGTPGERLKGQRIDLGISGGYEKTFYDIYSAEFNVAYSMFFKYNIAFTLSAGTATEVHSVPGYTTRTQKGTFGITFSKKVGDSPYGHDFGFTFFGDVTYPWWVK